MFPESPELLDPESHPGRKRKINSGHLLITLMNFKFVVLVLYFSIYFYFCIFNYSLFFVYFSVFFVG